MSRSLRVEVEGEGRRVDIWLASAAGISRSRAQRLVAEGLVAVDGRPATKSSRLRSGQVVELSEPAVRVSSTPGVSFEVRFEDDDLAVVAKPAGVVVHRTPGMKRATLAEALAARMPLAAAAGEGRAGIVHRLDKDTSGLLVVAKNDRAYRALAAQMRSRKIERTYLALVAGEFSMPRGRIEAPVGRSVKTPARMAVAPRGREAATEFRVLERLAEASLVEVRLVTGRTHQIRVHFAHIGHPVVGDSTYGAATMGLAGRLGLARPFLHAGRIRLEHPVKGGAIEVSEELPEDLERGLARARDR